MGSVVHNLSLMRILLKANIDGTLKPGTEVPGVVYGRKLRSGVMSNVTIIMTAQISHALMINFIVHLLIERAA